MVLRVKSRYGMRVSEYRKDKSRCGIWVNEIGKARTGAKTKVKEPTHEVLALRFRCYAKLFYCF